MYVASSELLLGVQILLPIKYALLFHVSLIKNWHAFIIIFFLKLTKKA